MPDHNGSLKEKPATYSNERRVTQKVRIKPGSKNSTPVQWDPATTYAVQPLQVSGVASLSSSILFGCWIEDRET